MIKAFSMRIENVTSYKIKIGNKAFKIGNKPSKFWAKVHNHLEKKDKTKNNYIEIITKEYN